MWVIAETTDLPTRYAKMVVTDDQGRYVVPDLPKAKYKVWVRGYGLVDSAKVDSEPGKQLNLTAVKAPNDAAAAQYYPAIYWYSMLKIPAADQFGGKSDIPANVKQFDWLNLMKNNGCVGCHQLGQAATRTIPKAFGDFKTGEDAWIRRTQSGQAGELMVNILAGQLGGAPYKYFGEWTDRVAKGELPFAKPTRPSGVERNVVVTTWDWSDEKHYLHDLAVSDKRNPTVNGYGPVFGQPEYSTDRIPILNPVSNKVDIFPAPVRDASMPMMLGPGHAAMLKPLQPSAYWGDEQIWDTHINNHDSMIDGKGRMWLAASVRDMARARMRKLLTPGTILCQPTTPFPAPLCGQALSVLDPLRERITRLCCHGGLTGVPQVSIPGSPVDGLPIGLSIIGAPGTDASLVAVARALAH